MPWEGDEVRRPASQETCHAPDNPNPVGGTGQEQCMTFSIARQRIGTETLSIAFAALLGLGLVFAAGFANASAVHDAAHDQRHAIAFPCH
jgi:cobalt transporter subunit CbtB